MTTTTLAAVAAAASALSDEAIAELSQTGVVAPPLARLVYRLERPFQ